MMAFARYLPQLRLFEDSAAGHDLCQDFSSAWVRYPARRAATPLHLRPACSEADLLGAYSLCVAAFSPLQLTNLSMALPPPPDAPALPQVAVD